MFGGTGEARHHDGTRLCFQGGETPSPVHEHVLTASTVVFLIILTRILGYQRGLPSHTGTQHCQIRLPPPSATHPVYNTPVSLAGKPISEAGDADIPAAEMLVTSFNDLVRLLL